MKKGMKESLIPRAEATGFSSSRSLTSSVRSTSSQYPKCGICRAAVMVFTMAFWKPGRQSESKPRSSPLRVCDLKQKALQCCSLSIRLPLGAACVTTDALKLPVSMLKPNAQGQGQ